MLKKLLHYIEVIALAILVVLVIGMAKEHLYGPYSARRLLANTVAMIKFPRGGGGTGFVAQLDNGKKVLLTNDHICDDAVQGKIPVILPKTKDTIWLTVTKTEKSNDICMAEGPELADAKHAISLSKTMPHKYERIMFAGHPYLDPLTYIDGYVVDLERVQMLVAPNMKGECPKGTEPVNVTQLFFVVPACELTLREIKLNGQVFPGNSGSPVINSHKELVGIINLADGRTNNGGMIPLDAVRLFVTDTLDSPSWISNGNK